MKKGILFLTTAMMIICVSCNNDHTNTNIDDNMKIGKQEEITNVKEDIKPNKEETNKAYPPMVEVNGTIYADTGYENAMVTCGTSDGEIKTLVDKTKKPAKDDESNFLKGCAYQIWKDGYINVQIDKRWILFRDINLKDDPEKIPEEVAHFTGKIIKAEENSLLVEASDIDEVFNLKALLTKPIILSTENLDKEKDGRISPKHLEGKTVEVYFGGEIKNLEPESSIPISLEKVYKIKLK